MAVMDYDIPKTVEQCRAKLREEFERHRNVTDVRVVDMLVIKVCDFKLVNDCALRIGKP